LLPLPLMPLMSCAGSKQSPGRSRERREAQVTRRGDVRGEARGARADGPPQDVVHHALLHVHQHGARLAERGAAQRGKTC
jgi:hypothetical protein